MNYTKLEVWIETRKLTNLVYDISKEFPKEELYGLTSQIRRASLSIPTNISEGCGRNSDKEFNQFLNIALGSASETEYLLILAKDLQYFNNEIAENQIEKINSIKNTHLPYILCTFCDFFFALFIRLTIYIIINHFRIR